MSATEKALAAIDAGLAGSLDRLFELRFAFTTIRIQATASAVPRSPRT
jgi:hypothetical protein